MQQLIIIYNSLGWVHEHILLQMYSLIAWGISDFWGLLGNLKILLFILTVVFICGYRDLVAGQ